MTATPQLDNIAYSYDPAGNITKKVDTLGGSSAPVRTECYRYDALDRLSQAWTATDNCAGNPSTTAGSVTVGGPTPYWTSWDLDPVGLRNQQVQHALPGAAGGNTMTTYGYGTADGHQPHTLTGTTATGPAGTASTSYGYDAAGNTTTRGLPAGAQTLTWDAENHLSSVAAPAGSTGYVYDADGNVLIRRDPGSTTLYLAGEEFTHSASGTVGTRYYTHDGVTVALRVGGANPTYLMADQHGTNQVSTDSGTFAVTRRLFDPYGNPAGATSNGPWPDSRGFLNAPTSTATGLTDVGARKYDPTIGRFISADPLLDPTDPQSLSGYAYADDNPVTNSDPTGLALGCLDICVSSPRNGLYDHTETGRTIAATPAEHAKTGEQLNAEGNLYTAKHHASTTKAKLLGIGKELVGLLADSLGITTGLECITGGGLSDCLQTAGTVLLSLAGGLAGKLLAKYGLPWKWKAGAELIDRLWGLAHRAVDAIGDLLKARGEITDAERVLSVAEDAAHTCANSFTGDTPIAMADGRKKPIKDVNLGDKVLATDPQTGVTAIEPVSALIRHGGKHAMVSIRLVDGTALESTAGHPIWDAVARQFIDAGDLQVDTKIRTSDGSSRTIVGVVRYDADLTAYNLEISKIHTYYAGATPVLVHNSCELGKAARQKLGNLVDQSDETAAVVIRARGGGASQINKLQSGYRELTLGELASWRHVRRVAIRMLSGLSR